MSISVADLEATLSINLDPMKASLYAAKQQLDAFVTSAGTQGSNNLGAFEQAANAAGGTLGVFKERMADAKISMQQLGGAVASVGGLLTAGLTAPLVGLGTAAFKAADDLRQSMATIRNETGATGKELDGLGQSLRTIGAQVPNSFGQVAQALAGLHARTTLTGKDLESVAKQELLLTRLTGTDLPTAVKATTQVFNQWGVSAKQQAGVLDMFYRAHQLTGVGVDQLAQSLTRQGAVLQGYGFSLAQATALQANLQKETANGEKIFSALRIALTTMAKGGITDANQGLQILTEKIKDAKTPMEALSYAATLVGKRGAADLVQGVKEGVFNIDQLTGKLQQSTGALQKAAGDTDSYGQAFARLKNEVELALEPLGKVFLGLLQQLPGQLKPAVDAVRGLGLEFGALPKGTQMAAIGLGGFAAAIGPVLFGIGTFISQWPKVVAGFEAIRAAVTAVGATFGIFGGLFAVTLGLLTAFVAAFVFNVDGLRDQLVTGFQTIWDQSLSGARAFFSGMRELGNSSLAQTAADWHRGLAEVASFWHAGVAVLRGETPVLPPVTAAGISASGFAQHLGVAPPAPPAAPALPSFSLHNLDLMNKIAAGHQRAARAPRMTPIQREDIAFTQELRGAEERLAVVRAGESNIAGQIAARFKDVAAGRRQELVAVLEQTKAIEKAQSGQAAFRKELDATDHKIRELQNGVKPGALVGASFGPGVTPAQIKILEEAKQRLKDLETQHSQTAAFSDRLTAAMQKQIDRHKELLGATAGTVKAEDLLAEAYKTNNVLFVARAEAIEKAVRDNEALAAAQKAGEAEGVALTEGLKGLFEALNKQAEAQKKVNESINLGLYKEQEDAWGRAVALLGEQTKRHLELTGTTKNLSAVQIALNEALVAGDADLALFLASLGDAVKADDALAAAHKEGIKAQSEFNKGINQVANALEGQFTKAFENVSKGGFRNFFSNMLTGLDQLLTQMAAKILAANLTNLFFGSPNDQGQRAGGILGSVTDAIGGAAQSSGGQGGMGGLLGGLVTGAAGLLGGIFGGGGTADAGIGAGGGIGSSMFTAADLAGFAGGGDIGPGQTAWVGEKGPELLMPRQGAHVMSNAQSRQAMGGPTIHMTINTPDAPSFRKAQGNIMNDLSRSAKLWDTRNNSQDGT